MPDRQAFRQLFLPCLALLLFAALSLSKACDRRASDAVDSGFKRALVTYAVARGLNAVISAAQGTEVSVAPFGMGVTLAPGEVLDPINDLIERFSGFMLVSAVALGSERLLIDVLSWTPFSLILIFLGGVLIAARASSVGPDRACRIILWRVLVVLAVVRFVVPLSAIGSEWLYASFLEDQHIEAEAGITRATDRVKAINQEGAPARTDAEAEPRSTWNEFKTWADNAKSRAASAMALNRYATALEETAQDSIKVIAIFLLSTFVFPVSIALALWMFARWLMRRALTSASGREHIT